MASLQEIKSRLNSITTTKKITKAMELVASAKLQKSKKYFESIQEYYTSVFDMFQNLIANVKDVKKIFPQVGKKSTIYVVITSDLGLCGAYNSNLVKLLGTEFKFGSDKVIILGTKGATLLQSHHYPILKKFLNIGDAPDYDIANEIGKDIMAMFFAKEIDKVKIVFTKFENSITFEPTIMQLLPVKENNTKVQSTVAITEFEPDPETVLRNAFPLYITALIFGSMVESKVSEMSMRRTSMESATDNAIELIDELKIQYNRIRQAKITQEITEIVNGANNE